MSCRIRAAGAAGCCYVLRSVQAHVLPVTSRSDVPMISVMMLRVSFNVDVLTRQRRLGVCLAWSLASWTVADHMRMSLRLLMLVILSSVCCKARKASVSQLSDWSAGCGTLRTNLQPHVHPATSLRTWCLANHSVMNDIPVPL